MSRWLVRRRSVSVGAPAVCLLLATAFWTPATLAQAPPRRHLTTVEALHEFSRFFHQQHVTLRGEFVERDTRLVFTGGGFEIGLLNPVDTRRGPVEIRAQMVDIGRLEKDDPRLRTWTERHGDREWPRPGTELALDVTNVIEAEFAATPSVRALALEPWKFEGQRVTIVGNFRGRNLFGDLPDGPGKSRYDFVLSAAEGAIWVTDMRPRGRGFDLDVNRRFDSSRWLSVTGVVHLVRGMAAVSATEMALAKAPEIVVAPEPDPPPVPVEPAEVVFSVPTEGETDVSRSEPVRVQFSKGLRETTLLGRVRATYVGAPPDAPPLEVQLAYDASLRAVQITFVQPLEQFRTVQIELLPGVLAFDGAPVTPWKLTYAVGSR